MFYFLESKWKTSHSDISFTFDDFQDPPGTNLGVGARAKVNQQLLERKKAAFIFHFIVNEPDD